MPYRSRKNSTRLFVLLFLGVLLSATAFSWLLLSSSLFIPHPSATQALSGDPKPIIIPQLTPTPNPDLPSAEQAKEIAQNGDKAVTETIAPTETGLAVAPIEQADPSDQTDQTAQLVDQVAAATLPATQINGAVPEGILGKKATPEPEIMPAPASQNDTLPASPETTGTELALANTVEWPPVPEPSEPAPEQLEPEPTESTESVPASETAPAEPTAAPSAESGLIAEAPPAELPTEIALAETETQVTPEPASTTAEEPLAADTAVAAHTGWIYAGQFRNGQWLTSGLQLDQTTEPTAGASYQLTWGANVRAAPPGQRSSTDDPVKLAETIATIPVGDTIKVVQVIYSGKNGHIWLEVTY